MPCLSTKLYIKGTTVDDHDKICRERQLGKQKIYSDILKHPRDGTQWKYLKNGSLVYKCCTV
jgi:hypothetical protein